MKLQLQTQTLRFRIDEAELAELLAGKPVGNTTMLPNGDVFESTVNLTAADAAEIETFPGLWQLQLPRAAVLAYVERLPCRDRLRFSLPVEGGGSLEVGFEVDVRDSVRARGVGRSRRPIDAT